MAVVKGVKEFVHHQLYDSVSIEEKEQLGKILTSNVLRLFVDVTGKTELQTNMQSSSLLPHWNTYEVRALRVVISDLEPKYPDTPITLKVGVVDKYGSPVMEGSNQQKTVEIEKFTLTHFVDFKREVDAPLKQPQRLSEVELEGLDLTLASGSALVPGQEFAEISRATLRRAADEQFGRSVIPPNAQLFNSGFGGVISQFIYNTVTTLVVGEKTFSKAPTLFFPAGAGPYSGDGKVTTHGFPSPHATFHFAEAVNVDAQQNFQVLITVPKSQVLEQLQRVYGPLFIWAMLDGYMTRDVQ